MNMSSKSTESKNLSRKSGPLSRASRFFYTKSNLVTALLATFVFAGYLLSFLTGKGKAFEVANSSIKSLGTTLGFGQTEILVCPDAHCVVMVLTKAFGNLFITVPVRRWQDVCHR